MKTFLFDSKETGHVKYYVILKKHMSKKNMNKLAAKHMIATGRLDVDALTKDLASSGYEPFLYKFNKQEEKL